MNPPDQTEVDQSLKSIERPVITAETTGAIAAPISVAGKAKISLISDKEGLLYYYKAPFHIAGIVLPSVVMKDNIKKIGRVHSIRSNQEFINSANMTENSKEALSEYLFRGEPIEGQEIVRTVLVHPDGPEPSEVTFTKGTREEFDAIVYSLIIKFAQKKNEVKAFGEKIDTIISRKDTASAEATKGTQANKQFCSIDVSREPVPEILKSLCEIVAKEYHFQGIHWSLNDDKSIEQYMLASWQARPPNIEYTLEQARLAGATKDIAEAWCRARGIIISEDPS